VGKSSARVENDGAGRGSSGVDLCMDNGFNGKVFNEPLLLLTA
jgi:hypothetical protein